MLKTCSKCRQAKPHDQFHANIACNDGRDYYCKECKNRASKEQRLARIAKRKAAILAAPVLGRTVPLDPPPVSPNPPNIDEIEITVVEPEPSPTVAVEPPTDTREQLKIARLTHELTRLKSYAKELEDQVLSSDSLRALLETLGAPNITPDPEWLKGASTPRSVTGTAVLFLSDIHADEVVRPEEIGDCNAYNREIFLRRMRNTFRNSISLLKGFMNAPKYDGMVCALGGDMVSGNIHDELVETNAATISQTMIVMEEELITGLGMLADEFGKVHVPCVTGNHGRMHKKPRAKQRALHNYEWSIYQRVASYFRNDSRLTFDIPDGPDAFFTVYNLRHCLTHGDQFKGGNGIGGIMIPILRGLSRKQEKQVALRDPFDVAMMGHWHQYIHTNKLVINGSMKGYDEYAGSNNFGFEPPQQALWIEHPETGVTFRMPVLCDKAA